MQTGGNPVLSAVVAQLNLYGKIVGAGAAAPTVTADGSRQMFQPTGAASGAPTRTSEGVYTVTMQSRYLPVPKLLYPALSIVGDGKTVEITSWNTTTTGVLTFTVRKAADGTVDDIESTDTVFAKLEVQNSTVS